MFTVYYSTSGDFYDRFVFRRPPPGWCWGFLDFWRFWKQLGVAYGLTGANSVVTGGDIVVSGGVL